MTPEHVKTMRGLAFEEVHLVKEEMGLKVPLCDEQLHAAVVLVSGNDSLFGEQGHNCVRIEFGQGGLSLITLKQTDIDSIDRWEHDCLGKKVAAVLDEWKDAEYNVQNHNCIHFAEALLRSIGIECPELERLQLRARTRLSGVPCLGRGKRPEDPPEAAPEAYDGMAADGAAVSPPVVRPDIDRMTISSECLRLLPMIFQIA